MKKNMLVNTSKFITHNAEEIILHQPEDASYVLTDLSNHKQKSFISLLVCFIWSFPTTPVKLI